jgi:hypothetical protein
MPFENPTPLGYVEPSPRTFEAIANAISRFQKLVMKYKFFEKKSDENAWNEVRVSVEAFLEHVTLFRDIAEKEVKEEPLNRDDYKAISQVTSYLNAYMLHDADIFIKEDNELMKIACVSDIATDTLEWRVLYTATGTPRRLYVFVNDKWGGPRVTIGYTYSTYEFERPLAEGRVMDEDWRKLVYDKAWQDELAKLTPQWCKDLFYAK